MRSLYTCVAISVSIGLVASIGYSSHVPTGHNQIIDGRFDLDGSGYVKNWLIVEPQSKRHYEGRNESGNMTTDKMDEWKAELPDNIALGADGPFGTPWIYHQAGENIFMEEHASATHPSAARMYAAVDLEATRNGAVKARLWIGGWADLWINQQHLGKHHKSPTTLHLPLRKGRNRFVAYMQNGGLRGIHFRLGLQFPDQVGKVRVLLPGSEEATAKLKKAEKWLGDLKVVGHDRLTAKSAPPFPVKITTGWRRDRSELDWPETKTELPLPDDDVYMFSAQMQVHDQTLRRRFEIPINYKMVQPDPDQEVEVWRRKHLEELADQHRSSHMYLTQAIARHMLGQPPVYDPERLERALRRIDQRIDCADFDMAFALRLIRLGAGTEQDRQRIKQSALGFKYWRDEPGKDGMCYHSENHRLLYHSAQLIAGNLWPEEIFTNSGNTGRRQAELGKRRCLEWLDEIEANGYDEFLSTTYVPITVGAVMNLVDFADDPDISRRAIRQMDKIYRMLAEHSFDGIMMGPQGRSYRYILYPQILGTQSLLSYATPRAVESFRSWTVFVASSPKYQPPNEIEKLMQAPLSKLYRQAHYLINLKKTPDYMLSSIEIPGSAREASFDGGLQPGGHGYQQHIWHAMLARDCHVFTNHPGASRDHTDNRPSFWAGSRIMPRQTQRDNMLLQIFSLPEKEPIQFTHAYWPSEMFDRQEVRGNWIFGQKNTGYIALWCSTKPQLYSEVLIDRELRVWSNKTAWVCICASQSEHPSLESFIDSCIHLKPVFYPRKLTLQLKNQEPLYWDTE
ncbi:MAG: hypothetical protein JSV03_15680 [Planctomycetota bacterium]|nr:MAG: hypothetical protein JSV03_15680 [Planctomycetota bacterium]